MAILNKTCCVCGTKYEYCSHCDSNKPSWMGSFHDENCKHIYEAVAGYYAKHYTLDQVKEMLDKCDLSKKDNFTQATRKVIEQIYGVKEEAKELVKDIKHEKEIKEDNKEKQAPVNYKNFNKKKKKR